MGLKVLGISGSPVKNSNTDRAVKAVLNESGLKSEFVKLSEINVRPCQACKGCVEDNVCQVKDDFPALAIKVKDAEALVIGAYCPYGMIDAHTKAFLERLWSMRHVRNLNRNKYVIIIVSGCIPYSNDKFVRRALLKLLKPVFKSKIPAVTVIKAITFGMRMERMKVIGTVHIRGNVPCLTCGEGTHCQMSGVPGIFGKGTEASSDLCVRVEDQTDVWEELHRLGQQLGNLLRK